MNDSSVSTNVVDTPTAARARGSERWIVVGVAACFLLSGFAALLYQTAWMREFSVVFGTSELAVAMVLTSYMAGLALGAALAGRFVARVRRPVLVYGFLEAAIAISALLVPFLLRLASWLYARALGGQLELPDASGLSQSAFYLSVAFGVLIVPTACMGATLPLLAKYAVHSDEQIGPRVGMLYSINTVGAIGGTLVAAFLLLPVLSLFETVLAGVAVNLLVFVIAIALARTISTRSMGDGDRLRPGVETAPEPRPDALARRGVFWVLPIMLVSGACTFTYEVLWTRLLSHVLGGSVTAFATMLASFLGGIALGSGIAARLATTRRRAFHGFVACQVLIGASSATIYHSLHRLIPDEAGLRGNVPLAMALLFPATLFIGATYPFAVRMVARDSNDAAPVSARVYAWNTVGAIVGASLAGFFLIPLMRYEGAIKLAVAANLGLAALTCLALEPRRWIPLASIGAAFVATLAFYSPRWPESILRVSFLDPDRSGDVAFYDVGRSATVLVLERDGFFYLRNNGLPEAAIDASGAPPSRGSQHMLTTLPVLARPRAKEMLVIGFGGGVALEDVAPTVRSVDVLELEPKVIDANRAIGSERAIDPLEDPRISVAINDVRSALTLTSKTYDVIVSQPSQPWTAGASHLYTREFMRLAHEHLNPSGVFLQWMSSSFVDESLLASLGATLLSEFAHVRVYRWEREALMFLASDEPLDVEARLAATGEPLEGHREHFLRKGVGSVEDLLAALLLDRAGLEELSRGAAVITDDRNRFATESAIAMASDRALMAPRLMALVHPYHPLLDADGWIYRDLPADIDFGYVAGQLARQGARELVDELAELLRKRRNPYGLTLLSGSLRASGRDAEALAALTEALEWDPDFTPARYGIVSLFAEALARGEGPSWVRAEAEKLTGSASAVLRAWPRTRAGDPSLARSLDRELAGARSSDPWFLSALKLRADWRNQLARGPERERLARESLELVDDGIAFFQDLDLYATRAAASILARDEPRFIGTASRMAWITRQWLDQLAPEGKSPERREIAGHLDRTSNLLRGVELVERWSSDTDGSLEDLRQELEHLVQRCRELMGR